MPYFIRAGTATVKLEVIKYDFLLTEKPWFHGKLEREQAAKRLRSAGMEEGYVRNKNSKTHCMKKVALYQ